MSLPDGRRAAVEIKLSPSQADAGAAILRQVAERVDTSVEGDPGALVVVTATGPADGVHVASVTALAP